jgi:hypothetical protein
MAVDKEGQGGSLSGLTEPEAKEFHRIFMVSFIAFVAVALIAHFLAWSVVCVKFCKLMAVTGLAATIMRPLGAEASSAP